MRGVGKILIACFFVKGLNCEMGISVIFCGECVNCKVIEEGCFIDLIEIDVVFCIKVEDICELFDNV